MTTWHIGCAGYPRPRDRYLQKLNYVEYELRAPLPAPKTFVANRKGAPEGFEHGLVAPASLWGERDWPLRDPAAVRSEIDRFANLCDALGASTVVFKTPMAISPGSVSLKRFAPLLERAAKIADTVVWAPSGLWQRDDAVRFAEEFGVLVACDPLRDEMTEDDVVYARLRGIGEDARYSMSKLEGIAEALDGAEHAYVVFESAESWREALGFRKLVGELGEDDIDEEDALEEDEDEEGDGDDEDEDEG
jgi:uncharacterized protein YecE (DUF72 family)